MHDTEVAPRNKLPMDINEKIQEFSTLAHKEVNEKIVLQSGKIIRKELKYELRRESGQISKSQRKSVKKINRILRSIKSFVEEQEDFKYLSTKEEVDETIGRLYQVVEELVGLEVARRVDKEIRELLERKKQLPHEAGERRSAKLKEALRKLLRNSPSCRKCGKSMVLRDGPYSYFWGCSTFPTCFGKKSLTNDEWAELPD